MRIPFFLDLMQEKGGNMNNVILVGRLASTPTLEEIDNQKKRTIIDIAVPRNFKNSEGMYEADFIRCILWNNVAQNTTKYCKVGDAIAIRGRIQTRNYEDEEGKRKYITEVIAQSISFVASSRKDINDEESKSSIE